MVDFFSGLLERSLNPGIALQRRRPSRFEPLPDTRGPGLDERHDSFQGLGRRDEPRGDGSFETLADIRLPAPHDVGHLASRDERSIHPQSDIARDSVAPPVSGIAASDQVGNELARLAEVVVQLGRRERRPATPDTLPAAGPREQVAIKTVIQTPAPVAQLERAEDGQADPQFHARAKLQDVSARALSSSAVVARIEAATKIKKTPVTPAIKPVVQDGRPPSSGSEEITRAPAFAPLERSVLQPLLPPMPRPVAAATAGRRGAVGPVAPAPATVHVSIGRIEIRAVSAPAGSTRSVQSATPRLSLDDYLKARNGGNR